MAALLARSWRPGAALLPLLPLALLAALLALGARDVNREVAAPYMDEPFHVPQAQRYCAGELASWDPKITTFPGLYLVAAPYGLLLARARAALGALGASGASGPACGLADLRLVYQLLCCVHSRRPRSEAALQALAVSVFPTHVFFTLLFYTDAGSLASVLLAYLLALRRRFLLCGLASAAAIAMRQTNAVWVVYIACVAAYGLLKPGWRDKPRVGLAADAADVMRRAWAHKGRLAAHLWPLALPVGGFAAFVVTNGGVVVGDREAHRPVLHLVQPLYFALFACAGVAPAAAAAGALPEALGALRSWLRTRRTAKALLLAAAVAAAAGVVRRFTLVHPYLLADNRHFTFYVWRRLLGPSPLLRQALAPAYVASAALACRLYSHSAPGLVVLAWALAACAALVPAHLVEPRYFTQPFVLLCVHQPPWPRRALALALAAYGLLDLAVLHLFLRRPFAWPDGSVARFMW